MCIPPKRDIAPLILMVCTDVAAHTILESKTPSVLMDTLNEPGLRDTGRTARCIAAILRAYLTAPLGVYNAQNPPPEFSMSTIKVTGVSNLANTLRDGDGCNAAADAITALAEYGMFTFRQTSSIPAYRCADSNQRKLILENPSIIVNLTSMLKGDHFASAAMSFAKLAAEGTRGIFAILKSNLISTSGAIRMEVLQVVPTIIQRLVGVRRPSAVSTGHGIHEDEQPTTSTNCAVIEIAPAMEDDDQPAQVPEVKAGYSELDVFDRGAGAVAVLARYGAFVAFRGATDLSLSFRRRI